MINLVLVEPRIPQNTGAIGRLCVCTGTRLHLVHPLGFSISDRALRRAGMDYWQNLDLVEHADLNAFLEHSRHQRRYFFTTHAHRSFESVEFAEGDYLVLGSEDEGLPAKIHSDSGAQRLRIPMKASERSLNLAIAAGVVVYDALRDIGYRSLK